MMPDREKIIKVVGEMLDMYKSEYEGTSYFDEIEWAENKRDALALLKEQEDEKHVLDEFGRCFLNALKRQLDMKLQIIELLITPEFAEKVVELIEKMFD